MNFWHHNSSRLVRVIDGDTVVVDVDHGFSISSRQTLRLYGINAPEMTGDDRDKGRAAKAHLESLLSPGIPIKLQTGKTDKYGRYVAIIERNGDATTINEQMVAAGMAVEYML